MESEVGIQQVSSTAFVESPKKKLFPTIGIVLVIFLVIIALSAMYFFYLPFKDKINSMVAAAKVPTELREVVFVRTVVGERSVFYRTEQFAFVVKETPERSLGAAISPDGTSRVIAGAFKNGRYVTESVDGSVIDPSVWYISVQSREGETKGVAYGYAPAFLNDTHIAYFSAKGIAVYDLATGRSALVYVVPEGTLFSRVQYAPDRTHVLWTDATSDETVVASLSTTEVKPNATFTGLISPILRNTGVYDFRWTEAGTELVQHSFDGRTTRSILTIPASMSILSMIP